MGVDTHGDFHAVVLTDLVGRQLAARTITADEPGHGEVLGWAARYGRLRLAGVEGTGSYGANLARFLTARGVTVVEVNRPDRARRRRDGKSDPTDAYHAARAALAGEGAVPKARTGRVEAVRALQVVRAGLVKERTRAANQLKDLLYTAPDSVAADLRRRSTPARVAAIAAWPPPTGDLADPAVATRVALAHLAGHYQALTTRLAEVTRQRDTLLKDTAPRLLARHGVGPDTAAQLLIAAGDNPDRLGNEARFAKLCGVSPLPASSGKTVRHRLNRSGDRQANRALWTVAFTRLRYCPTTQAYAQRRQHDGKTPKEIIRCLKRYIARELYRPLLADLTTIPPPTSLT